VWLEPQSGNCGSTARPTIGTAVGQLRFQFKTGTVVGWLRFHCPIHHEGVLWTKFYLQFSFISDNPWVHIVTGVNPWSLCIINDIRWSPMGIHHNPWCAVTWTKCEYVLSSVLMGCHLLSCMSIKSLCSPTVTSLKFLWPCTWLIISGHGDWTWCLSPLVSCHHLLQMAITHDNSWTPMTMDGEECSRMNDKSSSLIMGDHGWSSFSKAKFSKISMICPGCPFILVSDQPMELLSPTAVLAFCSLLIHIKIFYCHTLSVSGNETPITD